MKSLLGIPFLDEARMHADAREMLKGLGISIPDTRLLVRNLSGGQRQAIAIARTAAFDPKVLIMDEPTDGLDPNQKFVVREMIKEMAADKAIIISTHILEEVDAVCSRVIVIAGGQVVANGTPDELRAKDPQGRLDVVFRNLTMTEGASHV